MAGVEGINRAFSRFASAAAYYAGASYTFVAACFVVLIWALSGPVFHFSDTWQLIINTATTISTGLLVFLVQHTQNRDTQALHLKLDALLEALAQVPSRFSGIEEKDQVAVEEMQRELRRPGAEDAD